jgi:hypothetical protein
LVSLIGHSLGYWPHDSMVCISLQQNRMGATLRLDLPTTPDHAHMYARKVGGYLRSDQDATAAVFAIFTNTNRDIDSTALFGPLVEALAQQLALAGMPIQAGWIVGPTSIAEFRIHPVSYGPDIPLTTVRSSVLNAELIFRGSQIKESLALTLPNRTVTPEFTADVDTHLKAAVAQSSSQRTTEARGLWSSLINDGEEPTAAQLAEVLAHLQIPELRDRLIADMPGLDLPMELLLFGESDSAPDWDRIDAAQRRPLQLTLRRELKNRRSRVHTRSEFCPRTGPEVSLSCENSALIDGLPSHTPSLRRSSGTQPDVRLRAACPGSRQPTPPNQALIPGATDSPDIARTHRRAQRAFFARRSGLNRARMA